MLILVAPAFDGMPWLERVYQAGSLWDGMEMGAPADVHCYTPAEFERKRATMPVVRARDRARECSCSRTPPRASTARNPAVLTDPRGGAQA